MIRLFRHGFAVASIVLLLSGCSSGPPMRLYVLGEPAAPVNGVWSETSLPVIALQTVSVPDYLDSTDILRRTGPNEVTPSPTGRWGERLSVGFTRALASALSKRLPKVTIAIAPTSRPTRRIFVTVTSIDIGTEGLCLISAQWRITEGDRQSLSKSEHGTFRETVTSTDDSAIALAMTRTVDQLAEQIARTAEIE